VDQGVEDSISNLILYGASYANLPRLEGVQSAASETGELTASARARVHALTAALPSGARNERLRFVYEFLARKGIPRESGRNETPGKSAAVNCRTARVSRKTQGLGRSKRPSRKVIGAWNTILGPGLVCRYFFAPELRA
jgi:hypothetical protein